MLLNMQVYLIFVVVLFNAIHAKRNSSDCVTIETNVGPICGSRSNDGNYSMFLGIPYAKVDENNVFGPSSPHPKFDDVFEANDDLVLCPQLIDGTHTVAGSLDCLRLNIYVPDSASANNRVPVMVYIHGGFLARGLATKSISGPKFLVKHNIILVTLHYRVGPYGFMCLHTPEVPGNQGLKDQQLALRWVRDNIEHFGGDVERITIFGESAGARSIDTHLLSPHEKLFHRAILQSGSVLNPGWFPEPDLKADIKLAESLGYYTADSKEAIAFLSKTDPHHIIAASAALDMTFRLCIERENSNVDRFITGHPITSEVPKANGIDILLGYNSQEMISVYANQDPEQFETLFSSVFYDRIKTAFNVDNQTLTDLEKTVRTFYIGDESVSKKVVLEIANFDSDITYIHATVRNIDRYLRNGAKNLFYYKFSYDGGRNFVRRTNNITIGGAAHADERGYIFDMDVFPDAPTAEDQRVLDIMTTMWTNFAKYGDPTPNITELLPVRWQPVTKGSVYNYLDINLELNPGRRPYHERLSFWDLLYESYGEYQDIYYESDRN